MKTKQKTKYLSKYSNKQTNAHFKQVFRRQKVGNTVGKLWMKKIQFSRALADISAAIFVS
jgi:hypothetical protein